MKINTSLSFDKFLPAIKRNGHRAVYTAIIFYSFYIIFFLYQNLFIPFFEQKPIDPALIQRKKEVVNQTLYNSVISHSDNKIDTSEPPTLPPLNPFR